MDYRRAMQSEGEQSVGAWARRRRRRNILVAAGGLVLIGLAALLYQMLRTGPSDLEARPYSVTAQCVTCKARTTVRVTGALRFPLTCSACGERAVWPLWHCLNPKCGETFLRVGNSNAPACPRCGKYSVGAVTTRPAGG